MKIEFFASSLLALCIASAGAVKANAHEANPVSPSAGQYQDSPWDQVPSEYRDAERRGFHEGVEAARQDFSRHHHKDADDHEMYRHPPVEESARREFREGFREGYRRAVDHLMRDHDRDHDRDEPHF